MRNPHSPTEPLKLFLVVIFSLILLRMSFALFVLIMLSAAVLFLFKYLFDDHIPEFYTEENAQISDRIYMECCFSMLAKLALASGRVSEDEIKKIDIFIRDSLNFSESRRKKAIKIFNEAKTTTRSFESYAKAYYHHYRRVPTMLVSMIEILFIVAANNGKINPKEEVLIATAAGIFKIDAFNYRILRSRYVVSSQNYHKPSNSQDNSTLLSFYEVLGCKNTDSNTKIKSAYRKLVKNVHPDTLKSKDLPDEVIELAEKRFREIKEAYEKISEARGGL